VIGRVKHMTPFDEGEELRPSDLARLEFRGPALTRVAGGRGPQTGAPPLVTPEQDIGAVDQSASWLVKFAKSRAARPIRPVIRPLRRLLTSLRGRPDRYSLSNDRTLIAQSGSFAAEAYLRNWPELAESGGDPILHFLIEGWRNGTNPGPDFDVEYYLQAYDDVRKSGQNPLVHYLRHGKTEGRLPLPPDICTLFPLREPAAPSPEDWERLCVAWEGPGSSPVVDVVVPVHGGCHVVMGCLYSVLSSRNATSYQLVVIDDCSPQIELRRALEQLAALVQIDLHRMPNNLGFVGACNIGMALHPERDVILLNSDAEVFNDWIDRLRAAAYRDEHTGTVTPLSNNAEICSYPHFTDNNRRELELPDSALDELAARVNGGRDVEIPTGVGFCLYLRRHCLDDIGLFDAASFGQGYGEENDLSRRATAAGWRNILAPNVFVRHFGGASFGSRKAKRLHNAVQMVERRHPGYLSLVGEFIEQDPVRPYREALDTARVARRGRNRAMLFITHHIGGGTERHTAELSELLEENGTPVFFCRADPQDPASFRIQDPKMGDAPNLPKFDIDRDIDRFAEFSSDVGITHIHIHHLAGFPEKMADFIRIVCARIGIHYDLTMHDYMAICPRINLVDGSGSYCGEPELRSCEECIERDGSPFGQPAVWAWRDRYARLLAGARLVFVPDDDVKARIRRYFPDAAIAVRPHPVVPRKKTQTSRCPPPLAPKDNRRRVIILGAIGLAKGSKLLQDTAAAAAELQLPLEFVVIGSTDRDRELSKIGIVTVTGKYEEGAESGMLASAEADLAWFPAVWPETYSYTLSAVFEAGLFPVAFDLGAIANRIRAAGWGELLSISYMSDPPLLARRLTEIRTPVAAARSKLCAQTYPDPHRSYYALDDDPAGQQV
jgi:GT2 family glycosyltransferase